MRYLILILFISCNSAPIKEETKVFDTASFIINTDSVMQDQITTRGIATRAPAGTISDVVIPNTPDALWTKTKSGSVLTFKLDVNSGNFLPVIQAQLKRLSDSIKILDTENKLLKVALAKKDTIFYKGFKGTGTKLNPYEDIEP